MRLLLMVVLSAILLAGCTKDAGHSALQATLPGEADLPANWMYMAPTARPAKAAYEAHGMTKNPGPADPSVFVASGGARPDAAAGAIFLLRSSSPLQTLHVFTLDFGSEDAFRSYLANSNYCNRTDDFALVGNGSGLAALAVGANLSDAEAVMGAVGSWWEGEGFTPAC